MEFTTEEANKYIFEEAEKVMQKKVREMTPIELDLVWVEFASGEHIECSLVGRIDEEFEPWFMVENNGEIHSDSREYEEALKSFNALLLSRTFGG